MNAYSKKVSHMVTFGADMYRLKGLDGNAIFVIDWSDPNTTSIMRIEGIHDGLIFEGNCYSSGGNIFVGNEGISNEDWINSINKLVFSQNFLD